MEKIVQCNIFCRERESSGFVLFKCGCFLYIFVPSTVDNFYNLFSKAVGLRYSECIFVYSPHFTICQ